MNVVFNVRVIIASTLITAGVVIPRILQYFKLDIGVINMLTEPWATFLILMIALLILFYTWLKNIRLFLIFLALAILISFGLTMYFCHLPLSW